MNTICSCISRLTKSQEEIAHIVDENISVINITREEVSENRQALNKIIGILANLDVELGNITRALEKEVFKAGQLLQLCLQLDSSNNTLAIKFLYGACTVAIEHVLVGTPFTIRHYPKKFEGYAIRNRESFTTVFKITI